MTMNAKQFSTLLDNIRKSGAALDRLIAQGVAYASDHAITHGNFDPFDRLEQACPVYARKVVRDARSTANLVRKGKVTATADDIATSAHTDLVVRRNVQPARKGKPAAPAAPAAPETAPETAPAAPEYILKGKDQDSIILSVDEYIHLVGELEAYRAGIAAKSIAPVVDVTTRKPRLEAVPQAGVA